jgi:hypothetical protein
MVMVCQIIYDLQLFMIMPNIMTVLGVLDMLHLLIRQVVFSHLRGFYSTITLS